MSNENVTVVNRNDTKTGKGYEQLFRLNVFHTYFRENSCPCLFFNPDRATQKLMQRFGFAMHSNVSGIDLYKNAPQPLDELFANIEKATGQNAFGFEIRTDDPAFNCYTELNIDKSGQLVFDSNNITLEDKHIQLNQLFFANAVAPYMATVTIRFADILKFNKDSGVAGFEIKFMARATQWQYYIISQNPLQFNNLAILCDGPVKFDAPIPVVLSAGQNALLFSSGNYLIPLSQVPLYQFSLVNRPTIADNQAVKPQIILKSLPAPISTSVGQVPSTHKEAAASPIYVYL